MRIRTGIILAAIALLAVLSLPGHADASTAFKSVLFHDGQTVRTVITPVSFPGGGTDPIYVVTNGTSGQLGIAGVAPGDGPYHGGAWAVYTVTFQPGVTPYLLTSDEAVMTAAAAGDVTVSRNPAADFRCPINP
jgi:hypothetical protein